MTKMDPMGIGGAMTLTGCPPCFLYTNRCQLTNCWRPPGPSLPMNVELKDCGPRGHSRKKHQPPMLDAKYQ